MHAMNQYIFKDNDGNDVTFEELLGTIYTNSREKSKHIVSTVEYVRPMIKNVQDAVVLLPTLTQLQKVSVDNDDALIKLAAVIQRGLAKNSKSSVDAPTDFGLTEDDRKQLLAQARQIGASKSDV